MAIRTVERIQNESIKNVEKYCLEPRSYFEVENTSGYQLDLAMTGRAFLFRSFQHMISVPLSNSVTNKKLFKFYVTHSKPQYEVWTLKNISDVKKIEETRLGAFTNFKLTMMRGTNNEKYEFSFVDIPIMNPYYWIVIFGMLKKHESKFGSQLQHLKKMIRCYVMELRNMGTARSLGKNTSLKACDQPNHLEELRDGLIQKE